MPNRCSLCGARPITCIGLFVPDKEFCRRKLHLPSNQRRVTVYGLCAKCAALDGKETLVEAACMARARAARQ